MNKLLIALILMVTNLVSPATFVQAATKPVQKTELNYLFVQAGMRGSLQPVKGQTGLYQLELRHIGKYVHYFSDRPNRITGLYPIDQFINQWNNDNSPNGFKKMPPNAALSGVDVHLLKDEPVNIVLQLSNPVYNPQKDSLTYTAKILSGEQNVAAMKHLEQVALFIDSYCASCVGQGF